MSSFQQRRSSLAVWGAGLCRPSVFRDENREPTGKYSRRVGAALHPSTALHEYHSSSYTSQSGPGTTHGNLIDLQGGLAHTYGHRLTILATGTDTAVQLQVVADHGYTVHHLGAVADQGRALDRGGDASILDQVGLAGGKHELAAGDVHLAAAEVGAVDTLLHRADDLLRIALPGQHVGVGHARHRQVRVGLAATVTGGRHAHQAGVELVLDIALEDAVLDQHSAVGAAALVVHAERAPTPLQGAVVDYGAQLGGDLLPDPSAVGGAALAVEVALQTVADRLVQQYPGPARAHDHRHAAGGSSDRIQVHHRLAHRLPRVGHGPLFSLEEAVVGASATAEAAALAAAVVDRKSTRLNSSHVRISYAVFCLKKKKNNKKFHQNNKRQTKLITVDNKHYTIYKAYLYNNASRLAIPFSSQALPPDIFILTYITV